MGTITKVMLNANYSLYLAWPLPPLGSSLPPKPPDAIFPHIHKEYCTKETKNFKLLLLKEWKPFVLRVEITKQYHEALDASISPNFSDNSCTVTMVHNTDVLCYSKQTAIVTASDDFYSHDLVSHAIHNAYVAYSSVFLGEIMLPDWDMFHLLHLVVEYHASAWAISGRPVYVSDKPGDLEKTLDNNIASKIFIKSITTPNVFATFVEKREFDKLLIHSKQVGYTPDYLFLLQTILQHDPQGSVNLALLMSQIEGGSPIDYTFTCISGVFLFPL